MRLVGVVGSLRKGSYNKMLMRAAIAALPAAAQCTVLDLGDIPLFNADQEQNPPGPVTQLKTAVAAADAVLMVTPEYNYSFSGVLKNAIDWLSRPPADDSIAGKKVAILGASDGRFGTVRAQYHLRQALLGASAHVFDGGEFFVTFAKEKFNEQGELTDQETRQKLNKFMEKFAVWIES